MDLENKEKVVYKKRKVDLNKVSDDINKLFKDFRYPLSDQLDKTEQKLADNYKRNYHWSTAKRQNFWW